MIKLLYAGDKHIRGTNPRNRLDDYKAALKRKFEELFRIAEEEKVDAILDPGDLFDSPNVSIGILLEFADILSKSPVPYYLTAGNHDIYGYNLDTYWRTSLALMERLVPQLEVINDPSQSIILRKNELTHLLEVQLTFTPYSGDIDRDGYGYSPEVEEPLEGAYRIHVSHGMLLDHTPPFDRFTLVQDVKTTADLVLTGHCHIGYGVQRRPDGVTFANIGSFTRLAANHAEIKRDIQALLITVRGPKNASLEVIKLESAKLGADVLDRSRIEAEKKRQYAMDTFSALIKTDEGQEAIVDIPGILEMIASKEVTNPEAIKLALEKIEQAREHLE